MKPLLILILYIIFAYAFFETVLLFLKSKLQSNLFLVLGFAASGFIPLVFILPGIHFVVLAIFWLGLFLAWFGIKSHIESSILFRIIFLLKKSPSETPESLNDKYKKENGPGVRLSELVKGGFLDSFDSSYSLRTKGMAAAKIFSWINRLWRVKI